MPAWLLMGAHLILIAVQIIGVYGSRSNLQIRIGFTKNKS